MTVKEHYNSHLSNFYSWMIGSFESKQKEHQQFLENNNVFPSSTKAALDLVN